VLEFTQPEISGTLILMEDAFAESKVGDIVEVNYIWEGCKPSDEEIPLLHRCGAYNCQLDNKYLQHFQVVKRFRKSNGGRFVLAVQVEGPEWLP
jgi:hypothetical protein